MQRFTFPEHGGQLYADRIRSYMDAMGARYEKTTKSYVANHGITELLDAVMTDAEFAELQRRWTSVSRANWKTACPTWPADSLRPWSPTISRTTGRTTRRTRSSTSGSTTYPNETSIACVIGVGS